MMDYIKRFYAAAKGKLSTYVALCVTGVAALPDLLPTYWASIEGVLPTAFPSERIHHVLMGLGSLALIWLRVRREIQPPPAPSKTP
jgi:hypothetical protein